MSDRHASVRSYGQFVALPPGAITPSGWLRQYAEINANAWLLHYARNKDEDVYGKFWHRNPVSRVTFDEKDQTQVLCDYAAYFGDGMVHYAQLFPESELAAEAGVWIEQMLASQDPDGYLGAFEPQARWQHWLEVFSQSLTFEALLYRYQATGEARLLEACERAAKLQRQVWYHPGDGVDLDIFSGHGTIAIRALLKLYALTGDVLHLNLARDVLNRYGRVQDFLHSRDALKGQHDSIGSEHVGLPAILYEYAGDPALLEASKAAWEMMVRYHLSVDGTPHGNEDMVFKGPLHNCEHCGTVDWFFTTNAMARITGEVKYADAGERAMLNAYPAAKSPDGMTVAYMHTPNQLVASEWSQPHAWASPDWCASRQHYHSAHEPLCCNVNGPRGIPYYIGSMVMRAGAGLAIVYYGPCQATAALPGAGQVTLRMDTDYPFGDQVDITVYPEKAAAFALLLRIPAWCDSAQVAINGEAIASPVTPGAYAELQRRWEAADRVTVRFSYPIQLEEWKRSEFGIRVGGVAIQRGPLTYALPVKEDWQRFQPPAQGPGQQVVAYRVLPVPGAEWGYALVLDQTHPEQSLTLVHLPVPADCRPWEQPPIGLQLRARKVTNWGMSGEPGHPTTPLLPFAPLQLAEEETTVTLVPFGFTHLRMTYLPVV